MLKTVRVPDKFAPLFEVAQEYVSAYFRDRSLQPDRGTIEFGGQRYVLVRAGSLSVEFFDMVTKLYDDREHAEAWSVATSLLFDFAHAMGMADSREFAEQMGVTDPIARLSAGPIHFAHAGWAFVNISPDSSPTPDDDYYLLYDHPYSFESDAWLVAGRLPHGPVCTMSAGYSSGWCEASFGVTLVASEVMCRAKGDDNCRFIMAHPDRIEGLISAYLAAHPDVLAQATVWSVPGFFARKRAEDALHSSYENLKDANKRLEERVADRTRDLQEANARLERDIARRKVTEAELLRTQELNARIFDALPGALCLVRSDHVILSANPEACELLGLEFDEDTQTYGRQHFDLVSVSEDGLPQAPESCPVLLALTSGQCQRLRTRRIRFANGDIRWVDYTVVPIEDPTTGECTSVVVTLTDVSDRKREAEERRRLNDKLRETQRLEGLGILAGGVAHDFNNLLVSVLANASLARKQGARDGEQDSLLERIELAARQASGLTAQMLAYAGVDHSEREPLNLQEVVSEMVGLLRVSISKDVHLESSFASELATTLADRSQMRQVIMNLISNAAESIARAGTVRVSIGHTTVEDGASTSDYVGQSAQPGSYVYFEVRDDGCGIEAGQIKTIFDPFYTTKFQGRGLGLAAVLGIVRSHSGAILVRSKPEVGTTIRVLLPPTHQEAAVAPTTDDSPVPATTGLILIVDDDDQVRETTALVLEDAGYRTLTARDGEEGVAVYERRHHDLQLVILDATMPRLSGAETLERMRATSVDIPVLVFSGYQIPAGREGFSDTDIAGFLGKPFDIDELLATVAGLIAAKPGGAGSIGARVR